MSNKLNGPHYHTTSCIRIEISFSSLGGVLTPVGVVAPSGVPPKADGPRGLVIPLPRPGLGVVNPLGGAAAFGPSGDAGMSSGGRLGILIRFASLL